MSYRQTVFRFVLKNTKISRIAVNGNNKSKKIQFFAMILAKKVDFDHCDTYGHGIYQNILIWYR